MNNWALFPLGQLYLGFGQSSHLQVFPLYQCRHGCPGRKCRDHRLGNSPSCVGGVPRWRLGLEAEYVFLLFLSLLNLLKLTDPLLNINQNKKPEKFNL